MRGGDLTVGLEPYFMLLDRRAVKGVLASGVARSAVLDTEVEGIPKI